MIPMMISNHENYDNEYILLLLLIIIIVNIIILMIILILMMIIQMIILGGLHPGWTPNIASKAPFLFYSLQKLAWFVVRILHK